MKQTHRTILRWLQDHLGRALRSETGGRLKTDEKLRMAKSCALRSTPEAIQYLN